MTKRFESIIIAFGRMEGKRMRITSKEQMFKLANAGLLDNTLPSWHTQEEALASSCQSFVVRSLFGGKYRKYNVKRQELSLAIGDLIQEGAKLEELVFCEYLLKEHLVIAGDVIMYHNGDLRMTYSFDKTKIPRESILSSDALHATDDKVEDVLWRHLDRESYTTVMHLLDVWREHTVEFALYTYPVGRLRKPLIIFEIRCY